MNTPLFNLGKSDLVKGLLMALLTAVLTSLYTSLTADVPTLPTTWEQWRVILLTGVGAAVAYLLKNFLSNSDGKFLGK